MKINYSKKLVFGIAVVNFILLGTVFYWFLSRENPVEAMNLRCNTKNLESNLVGQPLPRYEFAKRDGTDAYQELMQGKVLMVVFLTNCQACLAEFDLLERHFSEISSEFKIAAMTSESKGIVEQFLARQNYSFPIYLDVKGSLMLKEQVACTPTLFFLENGVIRSVKVGKTDNYKDLMEGF